MIALFVAVGLVLLILVHELGHFLAAKFFRVRVDEFGLGFPPRLLTKKIGETLYSLNLIPFGGFVRIFGESPLESDISDPESYASQPAYKKAVILLAGVVMNILAGWFIISSILLVGTPSFIIIETVSPNSPADASGIMPGDIITGFNNVSDFIAFIDEHRGESVDLSLTRGSKNIITSATPVVDPPAGVGALGVGLADGGIPQVPFPFNFYEGLKVSFNTLLAIIIGLLITFKTILLGASPNVVGPVGIFSIAYQIGQSSSLFLAHLIALISLNLAVINLLPFPALDGGRLLFLLVEKIIRRPIPPIVEGYANAFGFILLILLMVLVTIKDISTLF